MWCQLNRSDFCFKVPPFLTFAVSSQLHRVIITCTEDLPLCAIPSRLGLPLLSPEFILTGVLKQEATPEAFVLSNLEMLST